METVTYGKKFKTGALAGMTVVTSVQVMDKAAARDFIMRLLSGGWFKTHTDVVTGSEWTLATPDELDRARDIQANWMPATV
jgi:hypothetical protein